MPSNTEKVIIIACSVLILTGAGASILIMASEPAPTSEGPDLTRISQDLRSMTASALSSSHDRTPEQIASLLRSDMESYLGSDLVQYDAGRVVTRSVSVKVTEEPLPVGSNYPPETLLTKKGQIFPNSELSGSSGSILTLPALRAKVSVELELEPDGSGSRTDGLIRFEIVSIDPERTLEALMERIGREMDGWGGGMARDMEYMLNSLVRFRTVRMGIGTRPFDTALNILNEGDVELAYNIAMGLTITRTTGVMPSDLLKNIDRFYSGQELGTTMNPTGSRIWGKAERDTFATYKERTASSGTPRTVEGLVGSSVTAGHSDSADLFLRYLHYDKRISSNERLDPLDDKGPLEELDLLNSRQRKDPYDTYSLEHHPSYPSGGFLTPAPGSLPHNEDGDRTGPRIVARIGPTSGYSVLGRDMRLTGLNDYKAYFTNADPSLNESDLVNYIYPAGTRCGAILPPPEPPSHDFRIQWDLTVSATLNLTGTVQGHVGSSLPEGPVTFEVPISFPLRIHSWFLREPNRDGGLRLFNINTGSQEITPISTRWVITAKANATEYFERYAFQDIREGVSVGTMILRSMAYREGVLGAEGIRTSAQVSALSSIPALRAWIEKGELGKDLAILNHVYIKGKGLTPASLGTIDTDGLSMRLSYLQAKDRMDVSVNTPEGSVLLSVLPVSSDRPEAVLKVTTPGMIGITVEPLKGTFRTEGTLGGTGFRDGPLSSGQPDSAVKGLLLQASSFIASPPSRPGKSTPNPSPYDPSRSDAKEGALSNPDVRLVIANAQERMDGFDTSGLPLWADSGSFEGISNVNFAKLSSAVQGSDGWAGLVARWNGENATLPHTRTLLFRASAPVDPSFFRFASLQALMSPYPELGSFTRGQSKGSLEVLMIDCLPSWAVPGTGASAGNDILVCYHLRYEPGADAELLSVNLFERSGADAPNYDAAQFGWTVVPQKAASPLW